MPMFPTRVLAFWKYNKTLNILYHWWILQWFLDFPHQCSQNDFTMLWKISMLAKAAKLKIQSSSGGRCSVHVGTMTWVARSFKDQKRFFGLDLKHYCNMNCIHCKPMWGILTLLPKKRGINIFGGSLAWVKNVSECICSSTRTPICRVFQLYGLHAASSSCALRSKCWSRKLEVCATFGAKST